MDINGNTDQGAAYVFERDGETWRETARLTAPEGMEQKFFGMSVAVENDVIVVGASEETASSLSEAGAIYVFNKINDEWQFASRVLPEDPREGGRFGDAVAMDNGVIMVGGVRQVDFDKGIDRPDGAVYFFEHDAKRQQWQQVAKHLKPSDLSPSIGWSVSVSGNTAATCVLSAGVVLLYESDETT